MQFADSSHRLWLFYYSRCFSYCCFISYDISTIAYGFFWSDIVDFFFQSVAFACNLIKHNRHRENETTLIKRFLLKCMNKNTIQKWQSMKHSSSPKKNLELTFINRMTSNFFENFLFKICFQMFMIH